MYGKNINVLKRLLTGNVTIFIPLIKYKNNNKQRKKTNFLKK